MELRQAPRPMNIDARGAPPVADIIAVCFTAVMFSIEFKKAMKALEDKSAETA